MQSSNNGINKLYTSLDDIVCLEAAFKITKMNWQSRYYTPGNIEATRPDIVAVRPRKNWTMALMEIGK